MAKKKATETKLKASESKSKPVTPTAAPKKVDGVKRRSLVMSAPHYKFENPGESLVCKVLSKIVPTDGEYSGKLIGWNVKNMETGEVVMLGNTHQVQKAFTLIENEKELWENPENVFEIKWLGLSDLGNGRTFNNFDIALVEI